MRTWACFLCVAVSVLPAFAADEFAASFRLRGGYDSNPLLAPSGKGSPLIAWEAAAAYGHDNGEWITGATVEASLTRYREQELDPIQNYRLRLRLANKAQNDISFDATTTLARFSNYDTLSESANQRVHVQWVEGKIRPFIAGDLRHASLNELNVLLGDFLPQPMRYLRGTITSGVAYVEGKTEMGIKVALARTKYEQELDFFAFRRDNDRVQPGIYAKYEADNISLAWALSYLRAPSQDVDFTDVSAVLVELSLSTKFQGWSFETSLARTAEDTTFPASPVTINTSLNAKILHEMGEKMIAGVFGRVLHRKYWDTPLHSCARVAGFEFNHLIATDISFTGELGFARSLLISGAEANGVIAAFALTKRFGEAAKK